ncbi:hypothetical protein HAX54_049158 [Datura stramonium]|uniref:Uncharacterized protein n=1 Tax=Datura stramonium TaxID=4076 RepID=A0ABS8WP02_DATST|nr:hypothetical protein [Datura stramonium]
MNKNQTRRKTEEEKYRRRMEITYKILKTKTNSQSSLTRGSGARGKDKAVTTPEQGKVTVPLNIDLVQLSQVSSVSNPDIVCTLVVEIVQKAEDEVQAKRKLTMKDPKEDTNWAHENNEWKEAKGKFVEKNKNNVLPNTDITIMNGFIMLDGIRLPGEQHLVEEGIGSSSSRMGANQIASEPL